METTSAQQSVLMHAAFISSVIVKIRGLDLVMRASLTNNSRVMADFLERHDYLSIADTNYAWVEKIPLKPDYPLPLRPKDAAEVLKLFEDIGYEIGAEWPGKSNDADKLEAHGQFLSRCVKTFDTILEKYKVTLEDARVGERFAFYKASLAGLMRFRKCIQIELAWGALNTMVEMLEDSTINTEDDVYRKMTVGGMAGNKGSSSLLSSALVEVENSHHTMTLFRLEKENRRLAETISGFIAKEKKWLESLNALQAENIRLTKVTDATPAIEPDFPFDLRWVELELCKELPRKAWRQWARSLITKLPPAIFLGSSELNEIWERLQQSLNESRGRKLNFYGLLLAIESDRFDTMCNAILAPEQKEEVQELKTAICNFEIWDGPKLDPKKIAEHIREAISA